MHTCLREHPKFELSCCSNPFLWYDGDRRVPPYAGLQQSLGDQMKKAILALFVFTLAACGGEPSSDPAPAAPVEAAAPDTASNEGPQVPAIVEFVWHQKADGFTDDALWSHANYWSTVAGEADWGLMVAAVMTPRMANENFDFLWVMALSLIHI